jgi:predicted nucleotidyltransferase
MDRTTIIAVIRDHRDELVRLGVESLSVVGSVARDTPGEGSDVDIAVRLSVGEERGFAHLRRLDALEARLSKLLDRHVDVIEEPAVSARVQREIDRDRVVAF